MLETEIMQVARDRIKLKNEALQDRMKYTRIAEEESARLLQALKREEYELAKCEMDLEDFVFE